LSQPASGAGDRDLPAFKRHRGLPILPRPEFSRLVCRVPVRRSSMKGGSATAPRTLQERIMTQYLVTIHHRDDYDPSAAEDDAMRGDIATLNSEMKAAGVRVFVGGLQPAGRAKSLRV